MIATCRPITWLVIACPVCGDDLELPVIEVERYVEHCLRRYVEVPVVEIPDCHPLADPRLYEVDDQECWSGFTPAERHRIQVLAECRWQAVHVDWESGR